MSLICLPAPKPYPHHNLDLFKSPSLLLGTWNCFLTELLISCPSVIYSPHSSQSHFLKTTHINTLLELPRVFPLLLEKTPVLMQESEVSPTPTSAITASLSHWTHASVHGGLSPPWTRQTHSCSGAPYPKLFFLLRTLSLQLLAWLILSFWFQLTRLPREASPNSPT